MRRVLADLATDVPVGVRALRRDPAIAVAVVIT